MKSHRHYVQLTPEEAKRLAEFLLQQLEQDAKPMELNVRGVVEDYNNSVADLYKALITYVVV
jgi:hypothetical protein